MKFIELTQSPQQEGAGITQLKVVIDQINFAFKQPLQPMFMVAMAGAVMPCIGNYDDVLESLSAEGFAILNTPEGSQAAINAKHVVFFVSPELGLFNLMFAGKSGLTVRATTVEIEQMFEPDKSPIIGA